MPDFTRRHVLAGAASVTLLAPSKIIAQGAPVTLNIIDVAGNLQLIRFPAEGAGWDFRRARPSIG